MTKIILGEIDGQPIVRDETSFDRMAKALAGDNVGRVMDISEAEVEFYKTHDCLSDDVDKEEDRIVKWANQEGITLS